MGGIPEPIDSHQPRIIENRVITLIDTLGKTSELPIIEKEFTDGQRFPRNRQESNFFPKSKPPFSRSKESGIYNFWDTCTIHF